MPSTGCDPGRERGLCLAAAASPGLAPPLYLVGQLKLRRFGRERSFRVKLEGGRPRSSTGPAPLSPALGALGRARRREWRGQQGQASHPGASWAGEGVAWEESPHGAGLVRKKSRGLECVGGSGGTQELRELKPKAHSGLPHDAGSWGPRGEIWLESGPHFPVCVCEQI